MKPNVEKKLKEIFKRVILCLIVLLVGFVGMKSLAAMKKPPAEVHVEERPIRVEIMKAKMEDFPVTITGFGEVKSLNVVSIAPEVSGKILEVHPRLEAGEVISQGELLFKINPLDYQSSHDEAKAMVEQWNNKITRLKKQSAIDQDRLKTLERNRELARAEYERIKKLFEEDSVGTRSGVEAAEQGWNRAIDQAAQLEQMVELYPIQIKEAQSDLASAEARLVKAKANLERCEVRAPFNARIKQVSLESGQFVMTGNPLLTLADDSILEIHVPLDSLDARNYLAFDIESSESDVAWFNSLKPVACKIRWTEDKDQHYWEGILHRVVKFDQETRTVTVAIRVDAEKARSVDSEQLPLVEGMFCKVEIPGKVLQNVVRLPRWAVSFKNTVYTSLEHHLKTIPVEVARVEGEEAFVSSGLSSGDIVVTTRLIDPLENSLLEFDEPVEGESQL